MPKNDEALRLSLKPESLLKPLPHIQAQPGADKLDAGLRSLDHYRTKLPLWRYLPRQWLIPLIRWETGHLARMQKAVRTPALDTYFSMTANLGTHTFFMIFLPILFWCGWTQHGRSIVNVLGFGCFFSGFLKDLWCLPRPLSPPMHRITMSKSVSLEYGFPSTHSTNAVSVAVYVILLLQAPDLDLNPNLQLALRVLSCSYATSIILGRLYCGMHGFFDVVTGSMLGTLLSLLQYHFVEEVEYFIYEGPFRGPLILMLIILVLVRIHPEPADDCPCFDDSVSFAGVIIGCGMGGWHFGRSGFSWNSPVHAIVPYEFGTIGWIRSIVRVILGVFMIFTWREVMKPALLTMLPPLFRFLELFGLDLPRRFFTRATEYHTIPKQQKDDNVIPSVSEIPSLLTSVRYPRRSRSVSIGPQSEADVYETMAYREQLRKESKSERAAASPRILEDTKDSNGYFGISTSNSTARRLTRNMTMTPRQSNNDLKRAVLEAETAVYTPMTDASGEASSSRTSSQERRQTDRENREMFSQLEKPRVRYDVEVVTKLIVYSGIGWIAVGWAPILFELLGLGVGERPR